MTLLSIIHWIYSHLGETFGIFSGGVALFATGIAMQRGKTIQKQAVTIMKVTDDAKTAPLEAQANTLEQQMEAEDETRTELEARVQADLNADGSNGNGNSSK